MPADIIDFPTKKLDQFWILSSGLKVKKPTCRFEYLQMCKELLTEEQYKAILLAIMDDDYFEQSSAEIKVIVECYMSDFEY